MSALVLFAVVVSVLVARNDAFGRTDTVVHVAELFQFNRLQVVGNRTLTDDEVIGLLGLRDGISWWEVDTTHLKQLFERHPWIERLDFHKRYLEQALIIEVEEAIPWLAVEWNSKPWLVSRSGELIQALESIPTDKRAQYADLPMIKGVAAHIGGPENASLSNLRFRYVVELLKSFEVSGEFPFTVRSFTLHSGGGLTLSPISTNAPEIVLPSELVDTTPVELFRALRLILEDAAARSEALARIDLRFVNQAIVTPRGKSAPK